MREITEAQAQELADLTGLIITVDKSKEVSGFSLYPYKCVSGWIPSHEESSLDSWGGLPFMIESDKNWKEQIWTPTKTGDK